MLGNSSIRQYGVVGFTGTNVSAAGFTGTNCINYKKSHHHQETSTGFIIPSKAISYLAKRFLIRWSPISEMPKETSPVGLWLQWQGANVVGADTRCSKDGTSSLFAFLKVAKPTDAYGSPSFNISLRTRDNTHIEPIDSLQNIFDTQHSCETTGVHEAAKDGLLKVYPNPAQNEITIKTMHH